MGTVSRPGAVALLVTGLASTVAGVWLHSASGRATPLSLLQYAAVAVGTAALGSFILWHRPRNRYGMTHLAIGVLFGSAVLAAGALSGTQAWVSLPPWIADVALAWSWISAAALLPLWVAAIAAFPDGRFHRRVLARGVIGLAAMTPVLAVAAYLLVPAGEPPPLIRVAPPLHVTGPLAEAGDPHVLYQVSSVSTSVLGSLAPGLAVVALLDRFRLAGPVLRQQIKWLLLGAAISVVVQAIPVHLIESGALRASANTLVVLAVPLPLVAAGIAIFKHGLWEIDVVISKGLVYALASAVLTLLFLGIALLAGLTVGGRDSRVAAALALALLVSFLAQPLRYRLEKMVSRLLYGDEPRGLMALAQLAEIAAPFPNARRLGTQVTNAARGALGASWAGVWLYVAGDGPATLRPLAVCGSPAGPPVVLPQQTARALRSLSGGVTIGEVPAALATSLRPLFARDPALLAPMTSAGQFVGLIACGSRPKGSFGDEDAELLAAVARESALALRNIGLEEELRQQLAQIEEQAAELHRSRHRLVSAQDQERRRIERDLHDGAQQQLVVLAARLRRAARAGDRGVDQALDELADEAEEAVFALQELARGIYPSLLADRGLLAALQAHAARLPAHVRVEVGPHMHGRRIDPESEAALYFVALEAMTNAVKHAPGAHIVVSLWADGDRRTVTLDVHDDGPGIAPDAWRSPRGIQNMIDRIEALGGTLSVDSAPGGGTWIRAEVPGTAEVRDIRSREATP